VAREPPRERPGRRGGVEGVRRARSCRVAAAGRGGAIGPGGAAIRGAHDGDYNDGVSEPTPLRVDRHARLYRDSLYVYPVLARRSHGISIGINLNPDKICNFDCVYCQVDRRTPPEVREVDEDRLRTELRDTLRSFRSGALFSRPEFAGVPESLRVLRDITFAGDGEPPSYPNFAGVVRDAIRIKKEEGFPDLPLNLLTNATLIDRPRVKEALRLIDEDGGALWLKLDAGTEGYYKMIERTTIPFARVLENILEAARLRPVVVQSLFMRTHGEPPPAAEVAAYCERLKEILDGGGAIRLVQVYTVARPPAEIWVTPLGDAEVDAIAAEVRRRIPGVAVETYYAGRVE
jgi:wyosine [tRNA(Phe)-imidazoG37] synthetase (radical SAM superfamily)